MSLLEVEGLGFSYQDHEVLKDMTFNAEENTILSILGPNGVGKTTLLKCICNLHKPTSGTMRIDGEDISSLSARNLAKKIAYVPQKTNATRTTTFDSVLIGRRPHIDWAITDRDMEIAWDIMSSLGLQDLSLKYVDEISGGEFQKVQIARAMAQEPRLLILDEPSNNLDIANQHLMMHSIFDAVRAKGMCTIMTMHDINLAVHYSNRFLFVKDGKIAAYGGKEVITSELIKDVYGISADVIYHNGMPFIIPHSFPEELAHYHHTHDGSTHSHEVENVEMME